ncbi:hypothetical protein [Aeromonas hydrophila]|uniref:hypothetical protein n=1 Tax=Aeromonas hydrophila TaxID=644 RepID=UPI00244302E6|nr:hypothetical protein [Aeromonas hydrophila]
MTEQAKNDPPQTQLVVLAPTTEIALFTEGDGINAMLADIRKKASSLVPDVTTAKGRKEIASVAYAVAKTKSYLDGVGKELTANRKLIRDTLDALKDEVRAPLTKFEEAEETRVADLQRRLAQLKAFHTAASTECAAADLQAMLLEAEQTALDDTWQELLPQATIAQELAVKHLSETLAARQKYETEQEELQELRKKQAEQDRIDRERLIAEQAAESARIQEEDRQRLEREAAQQREQEALRQAQVAIEREAQARCDAEASEIARKQAEANATQQAEEAAIRAAEQVRQRIADEQRLKDEEDARRLADRNHRGRIHSSIMMDLMGLGIEEDKAVTLIAHIAKSQIAHLSINY